MLKSRARYRKARMHPSDMAQTAFSHFTYVFFSRGLAVVFFYLMDFSLSLFNCLNNALEILLYAWLIGLNKVVHLILVIYLITDGFSPMVFIIHHIYFWRLNFEDFQNSPKLSVNDANVSNNGGEANRLAISKDETLNTLQFYGKSYDFDG